MRSCEGSSSLSKFQQRKYTEPHDSHGMPVPGRDVHDDLALLQAPSNHGSEECPGESQHSASKMQAMQSSEDVIEVAAGITLKKDTLPVELFPRDQLSREKATTKYERDAEPGKRSANRSARQS